MPASEEIHWAIRRELKRHIIVSVIIVALTYFLFLLPDNVIDMVLDKAAWISRILIATGGSLAFGAILSFVFFASDPAFRGNSKISRWVRSLYAYHVAKNRYECTEHEARNLWFEYFDTWGLPKSPRRNLLKTSYLATYSARLIFYLTRTLLFFFVLGVLTLLTNEFWFEYYSGSDHKWLFAFHSAVVAGYLVAWLVLKLINGGGEAGRDPRGCWLRLWETLGRHNVLFESDVVNKAATFEEACDLVSQLEDEYQ